jgi:hypothetical protein
LIKFSITDLGNTIVIQVYEYNISAFHVKYKGITDLTIFAINVTACA